MSCIANPTDLKSVTSSSEVRPGVSPLTTSPMREYILHIWQVLDNYTEIGVLTAWWEFLTGLF